MPFILPYFKKIHCDSFCCGIQVDKTSILCEVILSLGLSFIYHCSGVKSLCDLVVNILDRVGLFAQGKTEDLIGVFCTFLKNNNKDNDFQGEFKLAVNLIDIRVRINR